MKNSTRVSNAIIRRLPRYRRYLGDLRSRGVKKISSNELSELIGYTASQIRQDLNTFGGFGQQGYGYSVDHLYAEINKILGLDREYKTCRRCGPSGTGDYQSHPELQVWIQHCRSF